MKKRIKNKVFLPWVLCICLLFWCSIPVSASSWIDRDSSGIYESEIESGLAEEEVDENAGNGAEDEGDNWFVNIGNTMITALPIMIGDGLFGILKALGVSLDSVIYGRLVSSSNLFSFGLESGNVYGIVAAAIYGIIRGITLLGSMLIFMWRVAESSWKRGQIAAGELKDACASFLLTALLLLLMPNILDVFLFLRDNILYLVATEGSKTLFGDSSISIIGVLREAASGGFVNAVMYVAAVVLNLFFLANYGLIALSMIVYFILFPFVVLKSYWDRQVLSGWTWDMISCTIVPVIDATLLMIPVFIGVYANTLHIENKLALSVLQVVICWNIMKARELARGILGVRMNVLERSGIGASAFLAMHAMKGAKNAIGEWKQDRKNASEDEQNAKMESDLDKLDAEEAWRAQQDTKIPDMQIPLADEDYLNQKFSSGQAEKQDQADGMEEAKRAEDFKSYDDGSPFGKQQTYADAMDAMNQAARLDTDMDPGASLSDVEKKLAGLQKKRKQLEGAYADTENQLNGTQVDEKREDTLNDLANQIDENEREQEKLIHQREKLRARKEAEDLLEDPVNLQKELKENKENQEELLTQRQALLRERTSLQKKQDQLTSESDGYKNFGEQISKTDGAIREIDGQMESLVGREQMITRALKAQTNGLRDRQAYNLSERVKAQQVMDETQDRISRETRSLKAFDAKGGASTPQQQALRSQILGNIDAQKQKQSAARKRLAALSVEDARIAEKLAEIDPSINQYKLGDLQSAKSAQQVRRAEAQAKISMLQAEISGLDPSNMDQKMDIAEKKQKILRLTAQASDAALEVARLDQMMNAMKGTASLSRQKIGASGNISLEYDQKRRAVLERYATIDNFEEPQFSDISREKRAGLLRERALRSRRQAWIKGTGRVVGAAAGAAAGFWFGPSGMVVGSMAGSGAASAVVDVGFQAAASVGKVKQRLKTPPDLSIRVASDLHGSGAEEQKEVLMRITENLRDSLQSDQYETAFTKELIHVDLIDRKRTELLRQYHINNGDDYAKALPNLRKQMNGMAVAGICDAQKRVLETCAGKEYVSLSDQAKDRIIQKVVKETSPDLPELIDSLYLPDRFDPKWLR